MAHASRRGGRAWARFRSGDELGSPRPTRLDPPANAGLAAERPAGTQSRGNYAFPHLSAHKPIFARPRRHRDRLRGSRRERRASKGVSPLSTPTRSVCRPRRGGRTFRFGIYFGAGDLDGRRHRADADSKDQGPPTKCGSQRYREIARGPILGDDSGLLKMLIPPRRPQVLFLLGVHIYRETGATELLITSGKPLFAARGGGLDLLSSPPSSIIRRLAERVTKSRRSTLRNTGDVIAMIALSNYKQEHPMRTRASHLRHTLDGWL
jgi:hypothetical protein